MTIMNWGKETGGSAIVYPAGTYKVRISEFERCEASTGTPQIRWRAEIIEPSEHAGRKIIDHTALSAKALWRCANLVAACGVNTLNLGPMDIHSEQFDRVLRACVGRVTYWRNEESINPNTGDPKNNIAEYKTDINQEELVFEVEDDAPASVKETEIEELWK